MRLIARKYGISTKQYIICNYIMHMHQTLLSNTATVNCDFASRLYDVHMAGISRSSH